MNIEKFTNKLTAWGLEWIILGGYPRDLHHGVEPKDLDIIIYNTDYISKGLLRDIESELYPLTFKEHEASNLGDNRVMKVLTYKIEDTVVDLIFWNGKFKTPESVINNFDYNINQYHLDPRNMVTTFLGENEGIVTKVGNQYINFDRRFVIAQRANNLGWKLPDNFFESLISF